MGNPNFESDEALTKKLFIITTGGVIAWVIAVVLFVL